MDGLGRERSSQKGRPGEAIGQQTEQTEEAVFQLSPLFVWETKIQRKRKSELVAQTCNLSPQESEAGGAP